MNYCPNCGNKISSTPNFCPECGVAINGENDTNSEQTEPTPTEEPTTAHDSQTDRIQLDLGPGADRYYNLRNISYFQQLDLQFNLVAYAGFVLLGIGVLGLAYYTESGRIAVAGLLILAAIWYYLQSKDGIAVGTIANRETIETDSPARVEDEFLEKTTDHISIAGVIRSRFYRLDYTYHFLRENVISVERFESIDRWRSLRILAGGVGVALFAILWSYQSQSSTTALVGILIGITSHGLLTVGFGHATREVIDIRGALTRNQQWLYLGGIGSITAGYLSLLIAWLGVWDQLDRRTSATRDFGPEAAADGVLFISLMLIALAILGAILIVLVPRSGILISLPSDERVRFTMTDSDVKSVLDEFVE